VIGTKPAARPHRRALALVGVGVLCLVAALAIAAVPALAARPHIVKPRPDSLVVGPHGKLHVEVKSPGKRKHSRPRAEIDGSRVAAHFSRSGKTWSAVLSAAGLSA
jgi:hypothetical protein